MALAGGMLRYRIVARPLQAAVVEYNGDPGPSTAAMWRRSQLFALTLSRSYSSSSVNPVQMAMRRTSGPTRRPDNTRPSFPKPSRTADRPSGSRRPPARGRIPGYTGALTKRNEPGLRHKDAASFVLSQQLKEFIRRHPHPMHPKDISQAVQLIRQAPMHQHNAVVWNQMIHLLGRESKMEYMWKTFNDMKKRGITPTTRTYATLLNAYTRIPHDGAHTSFAPTKQPPQKQIQRVVDIYNESQTYISEQVAKVEPGTTQFPEIDLAPTNAYLKYLAKFGMWSQIERVRLGMDDKGPLAPNAITYTILFNALLDRMAVAIEKRFSEFDAEDFTRTEMGETARAMWDAAQRQSASGTKAIDEEMALAAVQCLLAGRPSDTELALQLIPSLWGITLPDSAPASMESKTKRLSIPQLSLDIRCATALISTLGKNKQRAAAAKYAKYFVNHPALSKSIDYAFLRTAIFGLSAGGDADSIIHILESYQPPTGASSWPMFIWEDAMVACRLSNNFDAALSILRRMAHIPKRLELGGPSNPYKWAPPNGMEVDVQGRRWIRPDPLKPSAKSMAAFIETALESPYEIHKANTRAANIILRHFNLEDLLSVSASEMRGRNNINLSASPRPGEFTNPSVLRAAEWPLKLAGQVHSLCVALLKSQDKTDEKLVELRDKMAKVTKSWGPILGAQSEDQAPKTARAFFESIKKTPKVQPAAQAPKPEKQLSGAKLRRAERRKPLQDGFNLQDSEPRDELDELDRPRPDGFGLRQGGPLPTVSQADLEEEIDVDDLEEQVKVEYRNSRSQVPSPVSPTRRGGRGKQLRARM